MWSLFWVTRMDVKPGQTFHGKQQRTITKQILTKRVYSFVNQFLHFFAWFNDGIIPIPKPNASPDEVIIIFRCFISGSRIFVFPISLFSLGVLNV